MKTSMNDDSFEFNVKVSSLPIPGDVMSKGTFMKFEDHMLTREMNTMAEMIQNYGLLTKEAVAAMVLVWFIISAWTTINLIRERTTERKLFLESHG